ncbi:hypothetical protein M0D68_23225 [Paraburkholderia sp. SEWSISQ10-3 4]|uniref:hypothetical protein n=1 Tax=Paraburkholderia TaxID=1822464 RepID=UPI0022512013|nr:MULTISPECIES: hypothetical protein [Paraburkholderia]MCX4141124.1 hypothetical protein [Paraburkholderia aspalathi]MDN7173807.1 hypothetical protein [Paraburkholderia sp. SEWSISQ10-3 4]MDQ6503448.1 hypothetical protein [Paraburkholderia aspalathi]
MDWNVSIRNEEVAPAYSTYRDFVLGVATHYAGSRLLEALDLEGLGSDIEIGLSNDFDGYFTTIRNVGDLDQSVRTGYYGQLSLRFATIQLCTAFEVLFDSVSRTYGVSVHNEPEVEATYPTLSNAPILMGNKTIKQIRKLHRMLGLDSVLNYDEVLVKLTSIIEVRNCFVHSAGKVPNERVRTRLIAYAIRYDVGEPIRLTVNHFDDFLHYMLIHVQAFMRAIP